LDTFDDRLAFHQEVVKSDPQANPVKLLAYDMSKLIETRELAFRDVEAIVKTLSDRSAIERARRLRERSGLAQLDTLKNKLNSIAVEQAEAGFFAFKAWAETPAQGIVLTAHPTFSLSEDIRAVLGDIASQDDGEYDAQAEGLKKLPYLQERAPTLQEEHQQTQDTLTRIQSAVNLVNTQVLEFAKTHFPQTWTEITPCLVKVYSWVGYDIDGRSDIGWGDAIRLRLLEKHKQLRHYLDCCAAINGTAKFSATGKAAMAMLTDHLESACRSTKKDLTLFNADLTQKDNLVAAANQLTRQSEHRLRSTKPLYTYIKAALAGAQNDETRLNLLRLRAELRTYGLGTARIHFRLNSRHVMDGIRATFGIKAGSGDSRTLLNRVSELIRKTEPRAVNFASLELEPNTAHQQMILTAQIHKYIDEQTPIRLLIAECEDSLIPLGMLYLAKLYGLDNHLDISPLFETATALNNGGRIIDKMLSHDVYKSYVKKRGIFAIQTGFSDAGRFMGQIPATLSVERLQSHFAAQMAKHGMEDVTALIFNTHGESTGRGGHPGAVADRLDYVLSPWAKTQFAERNINLCHETSFQGGDGFLWFQTDTLAHASVLSLLNSRHKKDSGVAGGTKDGAEGGSGQDPFYIERDFSWDMFQTLSSEQNQLYNNPDYIGVLESFGQNLLVPTGSRAVKRANMETKTSTIDPRQLRAIPHNAILQQFGIPANVYFGLGRAANIDIDKFAEVFAHSDRLKSVFGLAQTAAARSNVFILTAYARLFDPGYWIGWAMSEQMGAQMDEKMGAQNGIHIARCKTIAQTLAHNPACSKMINLANVLKLDHLVTAKSFAKTDTQSDNSSIFLHALRLSIIMKMNLIAADLPVHAPSGLSRLDVLRRLQDFQTTQILEDLKAQYPATGTDTAWTKKLIEKTENVFAGAEGFPHLAETVIKPLHRATQLAHQITIATTHNFDAYG